MKIYNEMILKDMILISGIFSFREIFPPESPVKDKT